MKRLAFIIFTVMVYTSYGEVITPDFPYLVWECTSRGNYEACSTLINNHSKLNEIKKQLQNKRMEEEFPEIELEDLLSRCIDNGDEKSCKKFINKIERKEIYDLVRRISAMTKEAKGAKKRWVPEEKV
jgi:hypothetical protein